MGADVSYNVEAVLKLSGSGAFQSGMGAAASAAERLQSSLGQAYAGAKSLGGGLVETAERAAGMVARIGAVGLAAGAALGGAATAVIGSNLRLLEDKSIQLAGVIGAATSAPFEEARVSSGKLFDQFKKDAITSAGETADFINVASMITGPIVGAGKSMDELRKITKGVMDTAPALGVSFEQAGSDVMRMLQGVAGVEQPLFRAMVAIPSLGIKEAKEFNKWTPEKRFQKVSEALSNPAFKAAAEAAGQSMTGLFSTATDQLKTIGGFIAGPTFDLLKNRLSRMTGGLMEGIGENGVVARAAQRIGLVIANRFAEMERVVLRLFPNVNDQAGSVLDTIARLADIGLAKVVQVSGYLVDHWPQIVSSAKEFAHAIGNAVERAGELLRTLGGGDMAKGLERAALLYGGGKAAAGAAPMVGNAIDVGKGLYGAGKSAFEMFGGAAAEAAVGGGAKGAAAQAAAAAAPKSASLLAAEKAAAPFFLGSGTATAGYMEMVQLPVEAASASASLGAVGTALAVVAAAAAVVGGSLVIITSKFTTLSTYFEQRFETAKNAAEPLLRNIEHLEAALGHVWSSVMHVWDALEPFRYILEGVGTAILALNPMVLSVTLLWIGLAAALEPATRALDELVGVLALVANKAAEAGDKLAGLINAAADKLGISRIKGKLEPTVDSYEERSALPIPMGVLDMRATNGTPTTNRTPPPNKGGGKVEVVLKWDLGDGDDAAIYVRNRQQIRDMTTRARGFVRSGKAPGLF